MIHNDEVPEALRNKRIFLLDMGALVAGASYRGEFEQRLKSVLAEVKESNGGIILFLDELHTVLGAGKTEGAMDAANLLKPMLSRGEIRVIGATTITEYRKHVEKDPAFERRFQQVLVKEPSVEQTISILRRLKKTYEDHHHLTIDDDGLLAAAELAERYIQGRFLPDKAIDLVDEACASVRVDSDCRPKQILKLKQEVVDMRAELTSLKKTQQPDDTERRRTLEKRISDGESLLIELQELEDDTQVNAEAEEGVGDKGGSKGGSVPVVTSEGISKVLSQWTGIPLTKLQKEEKDKLLHLKERLHKRVIGQDEAIEAVVHAILRSRAGLSSERQPLGSFLFLGPTGVGKTELAKAVAEELFDGEKNMVRIDMSEFMEPHSVSRLFGSPPGYVGHSEGGQLTEAVRRQPYSVVLFDEVEKAHPQVFNALLQLLDDGRLTDSKGKTVDFSNTVVILTSNLGSKYLTDALNDTVNEEEKGNVVVSDDPSDELALTSRIVVARSQVLAAVRKHFRPEFLNRLDAVVVFDPLSSGEVSEILQLQINKVAQRLEGKRIEVEFSESSRKRILRDAYSAAYGARPLKRYIDKHVVTPLSVLLISQAISEYSLVTVEEYSLNGEEDPHRPFDFIVVDKDHLTGELVSEPRIVDFSLVDGVQQSDKGEGDGLQQGGTGTSGAARRKQSNRQAVLSPAD